jgi:voltage-gated potassium channel
MGWLEIICAIVMCIWVPIRMLFNIDSIFADTMVDILCLIYLQGGISAIKQKSWLKLSWRWPLLLPLGTIGAVCHVTWMNWIMATKLLSYFYVYKINKQLERFPNLHPVATRLLPLAATMPITIHMFACGWIALGGQAVIEKPDDLTRYVSAIYWAITTLTTVGYGDVVAKTIPQMLYANATQIVGVAFFGYVLSNMASLLSRLNAARESHLGRLDKIESFFRQYRVPMPLRYKIRSYYQYLWETHKGYDDKAILDEIPGHLRRDIALFLNAEMIEKVPLLKGASTDLIQDLVMKLRSIICVPEEKIFNAGEPGDAMYFIYKGQIEILSKTGHARARFILRRNGVTNQ